MSDSDIEVQLTPRVREAVKAAIGKVGAKTFAATAGLEAGQLNNLLFGDYLQVNIVLLACQTNKAHGDPDQNHSSLSECVKGAIYRLPQTKAHQPAESPKRKTVPVSMETRRQASVFIDQKSARILGLSGSLISLLILFYFLGGLLIGPAFGLEPCVGLTSASPYLEPCLGSGIGLIVAAVVGLAYTTYFFIKKV